MTDDAPRFLAMPDPCACTTRLDVIAANLNGDTLTCTCPASTPPEVLARYPDWVNFAFAHLMNAIDTAMDELQRDRDFLLDDDLIGLSSPDGDDRALCIEEAIMKFVNEVEANQEA